MRFQKVDYLPKFKNGAQRHPEDRIRRISTKKWLKEKKLLKKRKSAKKGRPPKGRRLPEEERKGRVH